MDPLGRLLRCFPDPCGLLVRMGDDDSRVLLGDGTNVIRVLICDSTYAGAIFFGDEPDGRRIALPSGPLLRRRIIGRVTSSPRFVLRRSSNL